MKEFVKLRTVFLLDFGWSFMLRLTQALIDGEQDPNIPLGFCDHLGLEQNTVKTYRSVEGHDPIQVVFNRRRKRSETFISGLDSPLQAIEADPGDLAFVAFSKEQYKMYMRTWRDQQGSDALGLLLWWCGLDPRDEQLRSRPWRRLTRVLGGEGESREAVRQLLVMRRDSARLDLLDRARPASHHVVDWPRGWRHTAVPMLIGGNYFGVTNGQAVRVALGVGGRKRSASAESVLQSRDGLVWWDCADDLTAEGSDQRVEEMVQQSVDSDCRVTPDWAKWIYAEQRARRIALCLDRSFAWRITTGSLGGDQPLASAFLTALQGLDGPSDEVEIGPPNTSGVKLYTRNAAGFSLAFSRAVRNGLLSIKSDPALGFAADYSGRPSQKGVNLVDVLS